MIERIDGLKEFIRINLILFDERLDPFFTSRTIHPPTIQLRNEGILDDQSSDNFADWIVIGPADRSFSVDFLFFYYSRQAVEKPDYVGALFTMQVDYSKYFFS